MKNADMPAMPCEIVEQYHINTPEKAFFGDTLRERKVNAAGLTKREMMAMHVASGVSARFLDDAKSFSGPEEIAKYISVTAALIADALLAELERTK